MNTLITLTASLALLGAALVAGIFFVFSSFIMKALARLPSAQGIAVLAISRWEMAAAPYYLGGAVFYIVGTFLLTGLGNVPLNNQLAAVSANDPAASDNWQHYLDRWTRLNTIRTLSATAAAVMMLTGLLQ